MFIILALSTRMKGGAVWLLLIMISIIIPISLSLLNIFLPVNYFLYFFYLRLFVNTLFFPSFWFFAKTQFELSFRVSASSLLHFIPAVISLLIAILYFVPLSAEQIETERLLMMAGTRNIATYFNDILIILQFLGYSTALFFYIRKQKKYLQDNFSNSILSNMKWLIQFYIFFFVAFSLSIPFFTLYPEIEIWFCPIAFVITVAYLLYVALYHSMAPYINQKAVEKYQQLSETNALTNSFSSMSKEQMANICDTVTQYLQNSGAYKDCDFSLAALSHSTGIYNGKISVALNTHLKKNFFEIVNAFRVEETKRLLQTLQENHVIESIAEDCGFRSRSTFFATFKRVEGVTPAQWLKRNSTKRCHVSTFS